MMKLVLCAYCYHEVEQTMDGICPFCGGNLAEDPIEQQEPEFIIQDESWKVFDAMPKLEREPLDSRMRYAATVYESSVVKDLVKSLQPWYKAVWVFPALIVGGIVSVLALALAVTPSVVVPSDSVDLSGVFEVFVMLVTLIFIIIIFGVIRRSKYW
jgi:hypothetical protein